MKVIWPHFDGILAWVYAHVDELWIRVQGLKKSAVRLFGTSRLSFCATCPKGKLEFKFLLNTGLKLLSVGYHNVVYNVTVK